MKIKKVQPCNLQVRLAPRHVVRLNELIEASQLTASDVMRSLLESAVVIPIVNVTTNSHRTQAIQPQAV